MFTVIIKLALSTGHDGPVLRDETALSCIVKTITKVDWIEVSLENFNHISQDHYLARYVSSKIEVDPLAILAEVKAHCRYLRVQMTELIVTVCTLCVLYHEYRHTQSVNQQSQDRETDANGYACCCVLDYLEERNEEDLVAHQ